MSLYSAFYSGLSGLSTNASALNVIGNNLSNINTVGFKGSDMTFRDIFSAAGTTSSQGNGNPIQFGLGVQMNSVNQNFAQSSFQSTGNALDMAIQGNGFFTLQNPTGTQVFSRAGNFTRDSNGFLVASDGANVMGWNRTIVNGAGTVSTTGAVSPIQISASTAGAQATANVGVTANLNASAAIGSTYQSPVQVYDSLGQVQNMVINYTKATSAQAATSSITTTGTNLTSTQAVHTADTAIAIAGGTLSNDPSVVSAVSNTTVYDSSGVKHNLIFNYTKTQSAPADIWDVNINDSTPGTQTNPVGQGKVDFTTGTGVWSNPQALLIDNGKGGTDPIPVSCPAGFAEAASPVAATLTPSGSTVVAGGTPQGAAISNTITPVYDSLGVAHDLQVTYTKLTATPPDKWSYAITDTTAGGATVGSGTVDFATGQPVPSSTAIAIKTSTGVTNNIAFNLAGLTNTAAANSSKYSQLGGVPTGQLTWNYTVGDAALNPDGSSRAAAYSGKMGFDASGNLTMLNGIPSPTAAANPTITLPWLSGTSNAITLNFIGTNGSSNVTGLSSANATISSTQDGYPAGTLQSMTVDQDGLISGTFTNGQILGLAQLALSSFTNTNGLMQAGNNHWSQTLASGAPTIGVANKSGRGGILGSNLELSNVDVATEFTKLITSQRGYEANSKIVTTTDQLMQVTLQMKQ